MRKSILYIVGVLILNATITHAQELTTSNSSVKKVGDSVVVRFDAGLDKLPTNYRLVATPKLYSSSDTVALRSVIFAGRIQRIKDTRADYGYGDAFLVDKSNQITYEYSIPFEKWMANSTLEIATQLGVCGKESLGVEVLREDNLVPIIPVIELPAYKVNLVNDYKIAIKDDIVEQFPFVVPVGSEGSRDNALRMSFSQSSSKLDLTFANNKQSLDKMQEGLKYIQDKYGVTITEITIDGTTSIEGLYTYNKELSQKRAEAFIKQFPNIGTNVWRINNVGEDWAELIKLIKESDMPYKGEVLDIIARYGILNGREKQLMMLKGGRPYRYMMKHFFSVLRSASYVQVFYDAPEDVAKEQRAAELIKQEQYAEVLEMLDTLASSPSRDNLKGVCYMMTGEVEKAREHLQKAINNGSTEAQINLQKLEQQQKNIEYR